MGKLYFTCSFDDGDVADLRLADLLAKYSIRGTFYIPQTCNLVSKSLSENEIRTLAEIVEIGGHTMSHQVLTQTDNYNARSEISDCKKWLEDTTGKSVLSFCPPTGRYSREHIYFQKEAGYKFMRTVEMLSYFLHKIKQKDDFTVLPTTCQIYNHSRNAYLRNSIKRWNFAGISAFRKLFSNRWEIMSRNYFAYLRDLSDSGAADCYLHLWGHSWEIEKYSLWNNLEIFLKEISRNEEVVFCDNSGLVESITQCKRES